MNMNKKKIITSFILIAFCILNMFQFVYAYEFTTPREYGYTKLGAKAFSIQATGYYDYTDGLFYNISLGQAIPDATVYNISNITYNINSTSANWDQSTIKKLQTNELHGKVKLSWGLFSGTGFGIFQWIPCEQTCKNSFNSFLR